MKRFLAQALVIARRDFTAIVFTPTFLIFLLAPLFMISVGAIGGLGAARITQGGRDRVFVIAPPETVERFRSAERGLGAVVGADPGPPRVDYRGAETDPARQARTLLQAGEASAVLIAAGGRRTIFRTAESGDNVAYLALLATAASSKSTLEVQTVASPRSAGDAQTRNATAFGAVFAMFFLTLLLAGQSISMLAEERANKVIEILAAAVPLEAVFLGKLVGMLGVALLFTAFWGIIAGSATIWGVGSASLEAIAPAIGLPAFAALFLGYFVLAFLLLGAVFLGIGAQASTMREIQMLSLPITIFQVSMFAWASAGAGDPDSAIGVTAAIFPFSSPFAMAARAASGAPAWQHVAALLWQLLWLALTVTVAARLFRRGVLKSGSGSRS